MVVPLSVPPPLTAHVTPALEVSFTTFALMFTVCPASIVCVVLGVSCTALKVVGLPWQPAKYAQLPNASTQISAKRLAGVFMVLTPLTLNGYTIPPYH